MDSPNTSLEQGHLPLKTLDAECNLPQKRKLDNSDDSRSVEKSIKYSRGMSLDNYINFPDIHEGRAKIINSPSVLSSPKITERTNSVLQNYLNDTKSSPAKEKSVRTKSSEMPTKDNIENVKGKQGRECLEQEDKDLKLVSAERTIAISDSHHCVSSTDHTSIVSAHKKSEQDKTSELKRTYSERSICSGGKNPNSVDSAIEEREQVKGKSAVKKLRTSAERIRLRDEKMQAKARKREEKEIELERKKKLRQEMKENKEKAKLKRDKERQEKKKREEKEREEKLRHKMERKEQEEKKRLQKRQEKQLLLDSKLEEKRKKEEEKQRKLDDKKKAEEEEERKKEKVKAAFVSFFVKPEPPSSQQVEQQHGLFKPFEIKKDMVLAPSVPLVATENFHKDRFEKLLSVQDGQLLYLEELRSDKHMPFSYSRTNTPSDIDNDVIILDDNIDNKVEKLHPKLLQFCQNVRPPYWGTWRKKSRIICGRQPTKKDETHFDYDIDSDEEWDEGGPGESLSGTEDEKESDDDYEVDNEFLVPHGYLSNDEGTEDESSVVTPETRKALLKVKEIEFNNERSKKCSELKPKVVCCLQGSGMMAFTEELKGLLEIFSAVALVSTPIVTTNLLSKGSNDVNLGCNSSVVNGPKEKCLKKRHSKKYFPEEAMPHFIRLVHGNALGHQSVIREFREFWQNYCKRSSEEHHETISNVKDFERTADFSKFNGKDEETAEIQSSPYVPNSVTNEISKRQLKITLHQIAEWCRGKIGSNKYCWWVHKEVREQYKLTDLPIPNNWHYVSLKKEIDKSPKAHVPPVSNTPSIRKFAKVITVDV